jgi:hypothetical protein
MPLSILFNSRNIAPQKTTPFLGSGGVAPYSYAVLPGGAGGTIDVNGKYTAPNGYGVDTIRVTDASSANVTITVNVLNYAQLVCEIIQKELGLPSGRVWLFDQKVNEPKDQSMYVVVQVPSIDSFANTIKADTNVPGIESNQSLSVKATLSIDIKSRNLEALNRKEEVLMALRSYYSERQQNLNNFFIGSLASQINNVPDVDGSGIPYRYNFLINIQYTVSKKQSELYYDEYSGVEIFSDVGDNFEPIDFQFLLLENSELIEL